MASFKKTHNQQQSALLRVSGPHITSSTSRSKRKLDNNVRAM